MGKKAVWLSDIEFIEMHSSDWERLESEAFEADESVQAQLNPNQHVVLDWLKNIFIKKMTITLWYQCVDLLKKTLEMNFLMLVWLTVT